MDIPLPQVVPNVQAGGPLVTAMRGDNALSQDLMDSQIKNAQAQYAPWTAYADAASKLAYSQFVGPQAIANMLTNPATRGMLSPDQYTNLANVFAQQVRNPSFTLANMPVPSARGDGLLSRIVNSLSNFGSAPSGQPPANPMAQPSLGAQQGTPSQAVGSPSSGYAYDAQGNNVVATPGEVSQVVNRTPSSLPGSSPTYQRMSGQLPSGTYGGASPPAIQHAGEAALTTQSTEEAKAIADQWKARQDDIREQVTGAQEMERQLDRMVQFRPDLSKWETGPFLSTVPAISDAAQITDTAANNLVAARLKAWQSSRITNMDIGFGQMLKPGRWMNDDSFKNEVGYEKGLAERLQEYPAFAQRAQESGLTPSQADAIWARYANEKPFYDNKSKEINEENLGSWEDYLQPDSIKQTFSPSYRKQMQQYQNNMAGSNPKVDQQIRNSYVAPVSNVPTTIQATATLNGKQYEKINGKWYSK